MSAKTIKILTMIYGYRHDACALEVGNMYIHDEGAIIKVNENLTVEAGGPETFTYGHLLRNIGQKSSPNKPILKIPFNFLWLAAFAVLERLPSVLLTRDQILMLQQDNIALPLSDSICSSGHLRTWNNAIDEYLK